MPRARIIKPGFFSNEDLLEMPYEARLLFAGIWTLADRAGRLEDRPKRIKIELFPADNLDIEALLASLNSRGFIHRYTVGSLGLIHVPSWLKHQHPHHREPESLLPACDCESMGEAPAEGEPEASPRPALGQPEATTDISRPSPAEYGIRNTEYGNGTNSLSERGGAKRPRKPALVPLSEEERLKLLTEFPGSEERIALALAHDAHLKYPTGQYLYVRNWLKKDWGNGSRPEPLYRDEGVFSEENLKRVREQEALRD